jgi:RND family efflux transporter MFP subunit
MIAACTKPAPPRPPAEVTIAPALGRQVADWDEFSGHFEPVNAVDVRPRVSGFVDRVTFSEGSIVRRGDPLFYIDARPYQAEVERAEAQLAQARTRAQLAQGEQERAQRTRRHPGHLARRSSTRARAERRGGCGVRAAEAALTTARPQPRVDDRCARPIAGRISRAAITAGKPRAGRSALRHLLTTIVSLDPIYVYFDSDEHSYLQYVRGLRAGSSKLPVYIGLATETGFPHEGQAGLRGQSPRRRRGHHSVRAVVPNPQQLFAPGLFARVRLVGTEQRAVTLIQDQAVGTDQDRKFVLVLKPTAASSIGR